MLLITITIDHYCYFPGYPMKYIILVSVVLSIISMLSPITFGFSMNRFVHRRYSPTITTYHHDAVTKKFTNRLNFLFIQQLTRSSIRRKPFSLLSISNHQSNKNKNDNNNNNHQIHDTNNNVHTLIESRNDTTTTTTTPLWNKPPTPNNNNENNNNNNNKKIVIIGGGASGIFASIAAATAVREHTIQQQQQQNSNTTLKCKNTNIEIIVVEGTKNLLSKVKISGGGRCNVLHDTSLSVQSILNDGYPRGNKELKSIYYNKFTPADAKQWFEYHNVQLKTEPDGRMFPVSDSSQTIINTLLTAAYNTNVQIYQQHAVQSIQPITINQQQQQQQQIYTNDIEQQQQQPQQFQITFKEKVQQQQQQQHDNTNSTSTSTTTDNNNNNTTIICDAIIVATGSSAIGYKIAQSLGHTIKKPVPSLFTLNTAKDIKTTNTLLYNLAGVSVPYARIRFILPENTNNNDNNNDTTSIKKKRKHKNNYLEQVGPLLITHQGLSGPAALRLSSFGATEIYAANYCGQLHIHWAPTLGTTDDIFNQLWECTKTIPKRTIASRCPLLIDLSTIPSIPGSKISVATNTAEEEYDDDGTLILSSTTSTTTQTAIPKRLWQSMVHQVGLDTGIGSSIITPVTWGVVSKKTIRSLALLISECSITMTGKNTNKDEFVTAGGIDVTKEINMNTMSSKIHNGLYYCGEIINIDGVTGGFNFMNCWSTGYVAGTSAASYVLSLSSVSSSMQQQKKVEQE